MKKILVIIWGILTIAPVMYLIGFIKGVFGFSVPHSQWQSQFHMYFAWHSAIMLLVLGLIASYVIYFLISPHVTKDRRIVLVVVLFLGHVFAMPCLWYFCVWRPISKTKLEGTDA